MLTLTQLKKHIIKCHKKGVRYNFLGLVENQDLQNEVMSLFTYESPEGYCGYDWVNGNSKLEDLIKTLTET
jgi:hypothetical protein